MEDTEEVGVGMSFWDHLEEFRWTLLRTVIALFVFAVVAFIFMPYLFDKVIMAPSKPDFFLYTLLCDVSSRFSILPDFCIESFDVKIININVATQFLRHMSTSFWVALIMTFPYLVFEVWRFISPALYPHEKKSTGWVFMLGTLMFFVGCAFGYCLVFPMTYRFLATYELTKAIENQFSIDSYMDHFLTLIFIMGVVFELPLISWLMSKLGFLNRSFFKKYRRHAVVILLIASAFITPSGDPITLSIVFFPLYILYEISALFVKPAPIEDDDTDEDKLLENFISE